MLFFSFYPNQIERVRLNRLYRYLVEHLSTIYITSTLESWRVIPVIWLDLIDAINSQIAPFFCALNRIFFPAIAVALLKCNNQLLILRNQSNCRKIIIIKEKKILQLSKKTKTPLDQPNICTDWKIVYLKTNRKHPWQNTSLYSYAPL